MATTKKQTAMRLTDEGKEKLEALARKLGISQTAVMEIAVRQMAERENIPAGGASEQKAAA